MSRAGTRRTFLVGLGRFMMGATAAALTQPPVLYSFPSVIRIATWEERRIFGIKHSPGWGAEPTWISVRWRDGKFQMDLVGTWSEPIPLTHNQFDELTKNVVSYRVTGQSHTMDWSEAQRKEALEEDEKKPA